MVYRIFRRFIPLAFLATAACGLVYLAVQQSLRQNANDPQIQMAEDAVTQLQTDTPGQMVVVPGIIDINQSLAPYLVVYDASGNPVAGNGLLDGTLPGLPAGIFNYVSLYGEDHFTWQPRPDIRQAVVVMGIPGGGFVMAGRSLREIEIREDRVKFETGGVLLFTLGGLLVLEIIFAAIESWWLRKEKKEAKIAVRGTTRSRRS